MTLINTVFELPRKQRVRVIGDEVMRPLVWLFDIDEPKALPFSMSRNEFARLTATGHAKPIDDPWQIEVLLDEHLTDAERRILDERLKFAETLRKNQPEVFTRRSRQKLFKQYHAEGGPTPSTSLNVLRLWYRRGMNRQALIPDYRNSGAPGKSRQSDKKLGRPRTIQRGTGITVSEEMARAIVKSARKHYLRNGRTSLKHAHELFEGSFVTKAVGDAEGDLAEFCDRYKAVEKPTFQQYVYHVLKALDPIELIIRRKGAYAYDKEFRPLLKTTRGETRGIGSRYVVDATVLDVHVVSRLDRNRIIGRPTLYLIVDVATRMIVGFYVGLEPPSWNAAMLALLNVFEDKVAICKRYGLTIPEFAWPNAPSCVSLLSDGGEFMALLAEQLIGAVIQDLETAASFRGDAKSCGERSFGVLQTLFGPYLPGYVEKRQRDRGDRDPRLDAAFDLEAIRKAIILAIILMNNSVRRDFDGAPEIIAAGTPYVPTQLWQAYTERRLVDGRHLSYNFVAKMVRPRQAVAIKRTCVHFAPGLNYYSDELLTQDWYLPFFQSGAPLQAAFDPADMSEIEVWSPLDPRKTFTCKLTPASSRFNGCSLSEVKALRTKEKENAADFFLRDDVSGFAPAAVAAYVAQEHERLIKEQLEARRKEADPSLSNAKRIKDIQENRRADRKLDEQLRTGKVIDGVCTRDNERKPDQTSDADAVEGQLLDKLIQSIGGSQKS